MPSSLARQKRSLPLASTQDKRAKKEPKRTKIEDKSYFARLLKENGLTLYNVAPYVTTQDQTTMAKKIAMEFETDLAKPRKANQFVEGIKTFLDSEENLKAALAPVEADPDAGEDAPVAQWRQESLLRILLQVEAIQPPLMDWTLERMVLAAMDEDDGGGAARKGSGGTGQLSGQILQQIRWLNRVVDPKAVADKVTDMIKSAPESLQMDMIEALPEIVDEEHHTQFAEVLKELMNDSARLTGVVLHAFTYLAIKPEVMADVHKSILKTLSTMSNEDLPVVVNFVLQGLEKGSEASAISDLRSQLNFTTHRIMSQMTQKKGVKGTKDVDSVILHLINNSVASNRSVADAWFSAVDSVKAAKDHKPLDVMVLFLLHGIPARKRAVESLFKNKIRAGLFNKDLIQSTFSSHANAVKNWFTEIVGVIDMLSQSIEPALCHFALVLFQEAFLYLDKFCKQNLFASLVSKISYGGAGATRATALKTLVQLAYNHTDETLRYAAFVESTLDQVTSLELAQVRQIMDVLSYLAYSRSDPSDAETKLLQDNLHIVLGKQVSCANSRLLRMGVTGAVMAVKNMSIAHNVVNDTTHASQLLNATTSSTVSNPTGSSLKKAHRLLETVKKNCMGLGDVAGLFMDELSNVIETKKMNKKLEAWITSTMTSDFQGEFVVDVDKENGTFDGADDTRTPSALCYSLDADSEIALNLRPLVLISCGFGPQVEKRKKNAVARLIPHFRLLKMCVASQSDGDLEDVFALLGCPVVMPSRNDIDKIESLTDSEKSSVCSSLFYCANWLRELLNAFATQEDQEFRSKVLCRLKHLLKVNEDLACCLRFHPRFVPPPAIHIADTSGWSPPQPKGSGKGGKTKGKKRKADDETVLDGPTQTQKNRSGNTSKVEPDAVDLEVYSPFFRELDLDAFSILSYNTVTIGSEASESQEVADPCLRPRELAFLLKDLLGKMNHILITSKSKKSFPGKGNANLKALGYSNLDQKTPAEVAAFVTDCLDYLLGNLDELSKFLKNVIDINDGVMDAAGMFEESNGVVFECQELIFQCLRALFAWNGFHSKDQRALLKTALTKIGRRCDDRARESLTVYELGNYAFKHLERCSNTVVSVSVADAHVRLMETVLQYAEDDECEKPLADLAERYLKREWYKAAGQREKGAQFNAHVESMLRTMFKNTEDLTERIEAYVMNEMIPLLEEQGESEAYPTFNKSTFALHFRIFLEFLGEHVKSFQGTSNSEAKLDQWGNAVVLLHRLVGALKALPSSRVLIAPVVKHARIFLEHFLKHCMPLADKLFRSQREKCIEVLKNMQTSTRLLQHVCSYSKFNKDAALAAHIPALKKSLETFVYRVKSMLALNDAVQAFWLGKLKNRDIAGAEIERSQAATTETDLSEREEEEEEENALPEDYQSDVELDDADVEEAEEDNEINMSNAF